MQRTASSVGTLDGRTPLKELTGETPDITKYLDFGLYDCIWYRNNAGLGETKLGRWLGVSHRVESLMSYWLLTIKGIVISRMTVSRVTNLESKTDENVARCTECDAQHMRILSRTLACMKWNTKMGRKLRLLLMLLHRICSRKLMNKDIDMSYLKKT